MLSEPLSVTYDGNAKSLTRTNFGSDAGPSTFVSPTGEFRISIRETPVKDAIRVEITLERVEVDTDPLNGYQYVPNRFGLVYEFNNSMYNTATDIPKLRTALLAFVDSTLQGRLISGEK